jgi:hypothetical protein
MHNIIKRVVNSLNSTKLRYTKVGNIFNIYGLTLRFGSPITCGGIILSSDEIDYIFHVIDAISTHKGSISKYEFVNSLSTKTSAELMFKEYKRKKGVDDILSEL